MNSTRTSKSRDATSLHPVTKSCPFDLSTAPQSYAHLLLSLPNTKQTPRVSIFSLLSTTPTLHSPTNSNTKTQGRRRFLYLPAELFWFPVDRIRVQANRRLERERKRKSFLKVVFFVFFATCFSLSLCRERERERELGGKKKYEK